jgi:hypothetical protein
MEQDLFGTVKGGPLAGFRFLRGRNQTRSACSIQNRACNTSLKGLAGAGIRAIWFGQDQDRFTFSV